MCLSYSVCAGLIYWTNRDKTEKFTAHNEDKHYWGTS